MHRQEVPLGPAQASNHPIHSELCFRADSSSPVLNNMAEHEALTEAEGSRRALVQLFWGAAWQPVYRVSALVS